MDKKIKDVTDLVENSGDDLFKVWMDRDGVSLDDSYDNQGEIIFNPSKLNDSTFKKMLLYYDSILTSPLEYILTSLLSTVSGAVGKNAYYQITSSFNIYLNVWAVVIGLSSIMRKTTAINYCKEELQRIEIREYNKYKSDLVEFLKKQAESNGKKTDVKLEQPKRNYYLLPSDSTIESLSDILSGSCRGLLVHSEFGSMLTQLNRSYAGNSKQFFTEIYDLPIVYEITRSTKQNTLLQRPFISIIAASTIDWIRENSTPADLRTGFLARFIFSIRNKPDKAFIPILKLSQVTKRSQFYFNVAEVFEFLITIKDKELQIEDDARELHMKYDTMSYNEMLNYDSEHELSFKTRLATYSLKFAAIIALCDRRFVVNKNDIMDAMYITEYYKKNVELLLNKEMVRTEFTRSEEKIIHLIKNAGGGLKHSKLLKDSHLKSKDLTELIQNLIEKDIISEKSKKGSGSKHIREYYLNNGKAHIGNDETVQSDRWSRKIGEG